MEPKNRVLRRVSTSLLELCHVEMPRGAQSHRSTCPDGQFWFLTSGRVAVQGETKSREHVGGELAYYAPRQGAMRTVDRPSRGYGLQIKVSRLVEGEFASEWSHLDHLRPSDLSRVLRIIRVGMEPEADSHRLDEWVAQWVSTATSVRESKPSSWLRRAEEIVANDPNRALAEVAREVGVVPAYLSSEYHRWRGQTLSRFRRECRVRRVLALRAHFDLPEAAIEAGFYDISHFHRACRQDLGLSPRELDRLLQT